MTATIAPYGTWKSPISSDLIVAKTIRLLDVALDGEDAFWLEGRPSEGGRSVLVRRSPDGTIADVTPPGFNARTRVHEYGGGAFLVRNGTVYFSNFADGGLYRQSLNPPNGEPELLTPLEDLEATRYADLVLDGERDRLICVREDHRDEAGEAPAEPRNAIVAVPLAGGPTEILFAGDDFYASPRLSPDGCWLAWLSWNHPLMPWDETALWVARANANGSFQLPKRIDSGGSSNFQPEWSPDGKLYWVCDETGWWNLYRCHDVVRGGAELVFPYAAEFGLPQWVFGMTTYGFASGDRIFCTYTQNGLWYLAEIDPQRKSLRQLASEYTQHGAIVASGDRALLLASSPTQFVSVVERDLKEGSERVLCRASDLEIPTGYLSQPQPIEFPTEGDRTAYGIFYPPQNQDFQAPKGEKPPLLVKSHGGPTAATSSGLSLRVQYWTSRGFALLDVNYGGSTGYGRAYRQRLQGQWGIVDVDDCINGAKYLAKKGWVDGDRMAISGGSAGGYTTLGTLVFRDVFRAGASYYGVSDLEALARDTHKFESRYLDGLVGPYPEAVETYRARSPIHACDKLSCPVIFFQGLEDKVVPPNQAEMMVRVLKDKGLPVAYVPFPGEQHGFRRAENIKRAIDGEFYFYARAFGFEPADEIEPIEIFNLSPQG